MGTGTGTGIGQAATSETLYTKAQLDAAVKGAYSDDYTQAQNELKPPSTFQKCVANLFSVDKLLRATTGVLVGLTVAGIVGTAAVFSGGTVLALGAAVGLAYYLHFSPKDSSPPPSYSTVQSSYPGGNYNQNARGTNPSLDAAAKVSTDGDNGETVMSKQSDLLTGVYHTNTGGSHEGKASTTPVMESNLIDLSDDVGERFGAALTKPPRLGTISGNKDSSTKSHTLTRTYSESAIGEEASRKASNEPSRFVDAVTLANNGVGEKAEETNETIQSALMIDIPTSGSFSAPLSVSSQPEIELFSANSNTDGSKSGIGEYATNKIPHFSGDELKQIRRILNDTNSESKTEDT